MLKLYLFMWVLLLLLFFKKKKRPTLLLMDRDELEQLAARFPQQFRIHHVPFNDRGRVIIIGDIHGCVDEFNALLRKVHFVKGIDTLVLVGDLVNRGPHSIETVEKAMELGALSVLGNHDHTLLELRGKAERGEYISQRDRFAVDAVRMPSECVAWLRKLPHVLKITQYNSIVVHAGLNVNLPLERQDPMDVMFMRRITSTGKVIYKLKEWEGADSGTQWAKLWRGGEKVCPGVNRQTVIFGHDAAAGLQKEEYAWGIDTGCVHGSFLTALELPGWNIHQVQRQSLSQRLKARGQRNEDGEDSDIASNAPTPNATPIMESPVFPAAPHQRADRLQIPQTAPVAAAAAAPPPPIPPPAAVASTKRILTPGMLLGKVTEAPAAATSAASEKSSVSSPIARLITATRGRNVVHSPTPQPQPLSPAAPRPPPQQEAPKSDGPSFAAPSLPSATASMPVGSSEQEAGQQPELTHLRTDTLRTLVKLGGKVLFDFLDSDAFAEQRAAMLEDGGVSAALWAEVCVHLVELCVRGFRPDETLGLVIEIVSQSEKIRAAAEPKLRPALVPMSKVAAVDAKDIKSLSVVLRPPAAPFAR